MKAIHGKLIKKKNLDISHQIECGWIYGTLNTFSCKISLFKKIK